MNEPVRPLSASLSDVCFVHWPYPPAEVEALLPPWLEPDTEDGRAWVTALPLTMARFDLLGVPVRERVEGVNLRTYVRTSDGTRGVWFLSLDVDDRIAAETARSVFQLPYHRARIRRRTQGERTEVVARRRGDGDARLAVTFEPEGEPLEPGPDTLPSFLIERHRYFTNGPLGTRLRGSVGHPPWPVQPATVAVAENTLLDAAGLGDPDDDPLVHYSPGVEMGIGALGPV